MEEPCGSALGGEGGAVKGRRPRNHGSPGGRSFGGNPRTPVSARKGGGSAKKEKEYEDDEHRLQQRLKQIQYGENTSGYHNFQKILAKDSGLLKGCVPVKPSVHQKCSKRSWDGQVRKWRRALHMYDYVDFGESEEQSKEVKDALTLQSLNVKFTPQKRNPAGEDSDDYEAESDDPDVSLQATPAKAEVPQSPVRYSCEQLLALAESSLVAERVSLPSSLAWLDKRVDLEDEVDEEGHLPPTSPQPLGSPASNAFFTPSVSSPGRRLFTPEKCNDIWSYPEPGAPESPSGWQNATTSPEPAGRAA